MPTYHCLVRDARREFHHPPLLATSFPAAARELAQRGLSVVRVREESQASLWRDAERALTSFFRNLADALRASTPLAEALQLVGAESKHPLIQRVCREMLVDVRNGEQLSAAMARRGGIFSEVHARMVEAGEVSGQLVSTLEAVAEYREGVGEVAGQVWRALTYPLLVVLAISGVFTFLCTFVLPKFMEVFRDFRVELPALTLFVLSLRHFVLPVFVAGVLAAFFASFLLRIATLFRSTRLRLDAWFISAPIVGGVIYDLGLSRLLSTLSLLSRAPLTMPELLAIGGRATGNLLMETRLLRAAAQTAEGARLSDALADHEALPQEIIWHLAVAQQTGALTTAFAVLAAQCLARTRQRAQRLDTLLEPLFVILAGLSVGTIVVACFLPLLQIITNLTNE